MRAAITAQAARAAQFEKEDVLKNYRGLHAEKRRLETGVDELQLTRQRLTKVCQSVFFLFFWRAELDVLVFFFCFAAPSSRLVVCAAAGWVESMEGWVLTTETPTRFL